MRIVGTIRLPAQVKFFVGEHSNVRHIGTEHELLCGAYLTLERPTTESLAICRHCERRYRRGVRQLIDNAERAGISI